MSGRQAAILPRPRPPPHPTPPDSLPWKLEEARRPIKGSPGPQPGRALCQDAGLWPSSCATSLPCSSQPRTSGAHPWVSLLPRKSLCHMCDWTYCPYSRPHDCPAHVVAPSTTAPTFDRDLLDLPGFLIDPLLSADFLRGAHEFFEFLNLLSTRKQESTEEL